MGLREIEYAEEYRSGEDDALTSFFLPSFKVARTYDRAVGYFSSSALECFAEPFEHFVQFGGIVRLVASVEVHRDDLEAIERQSGREAACEARILEIIDQEFSGKTFSTGVRKLASLLEMGRLEIRIAVPKSGFGIYHEKVGIFDGSAPDYVAFAGSTNESRQALQYNYECVDVFPSWQAPSRALKKKKHFEALWDGRARGATTYAFPDAAKRKLIRAVLHEPTVPGGQGHSDESSLWPHQRKALQAFLSKQRGILEMATGTGKTRTALAVLGHLINHGSIRTAIVTADGSDLLDQWAADLATRLQESSPRFRLLKHYREHHQRDEYLIDSDLSVLLCSRQALRPVLKRMSAQEKRDAFVVHDEVHRFGSASHVAELDGETDNVSWRLGLSATPDREYDQAGNEFIERNVGEVIFRYPLEDAIADGVLCEFDYLPLEWDPSAEDKREVKMLMARRSARDAAGHPVMSEEEFRREVARVYKVSVEKVPLFVAFVQEHPEALERCIVFLAEKSYGLSVSEHIHAVTPRFRTYFDADEPAALKEFASGIIDCLLTCHRVSEGIDIRSVRTVVLLSADRARLETIQRIGRCLRTDPMNPSKRALVVDFIRRRSDPAGEPTGDELRRQWLETLSQIKGKVHVSQ
jgi:superfamily II DNA or RNA helicase